MTIRVYLITLFTFLIVNNSNAQEYHWAYSVGGSGQDPSADITHDDVGNVYTVGTFDGSVDFDPGAGSSVLMNTGASDVFVQKVDVLGNFIWARSYGGADQIVVRAIRVDANGNVYIAGFYYGVVDFDPGTAVFNLTSNGDADIYIQKLDAMGNFLWAKSIGGMENDFAYGLSLDAQGNLSATGQFSLTVDFDPNAGISNLTSAGDYDVFILKMDSSGSLIWAKSAGAVDEDFAKELDHDAMGNVYVLGTFRNTVDFDPGAGVDNFTSLGFGDIFILKLDINGNYIWARTFGSVNVDNAADLVVDANGNAHSTGYYSGSIDLDPGIAVSNASSLGLRDIFVHKLDAAGNFVWGSSFGSIANDLAYGIGLDSAGNVYSTGTFEWTADFDPGPGVFDIPNEGQSDIYFQKLDAQGNFIWAKSVGSITAEYPSCMTVDKAGNAMCSGYYRDSLDLNPGSVTNTFISNGNFDVFVLKLGDNYALSVNEIEQNKAIPVSFYPNPTSNVLNIAFENEPEGILEARVLDVSGKLLKNVSFQRNEPKQISLMGLSEQIYIVQLFENKELVHSALVKKE